MDYPRLRITSHGPTKAPTSTVCQKCLKKGHYSYECKGSLQSRPYNSRPSRSEQLRNPKLKPKLTEQKLQDPIDIFAAAAIGSSSKSDQTTIKTSGDPPQTSAVPPVSKRSASVSSVDSVSTISTSKTRSRSISPVPDSPRHEAMVESRRVAVPRRRSRSRSPRRSDSHERYRRRSPDEKLPARDSPSDRPPPKSRESPSPHSRRLALTQALHKN